MINEFLRAIFTVPRCIVCGVRVESHEPPLCEACRRRYFTEKAKFCSGCGFPHPECRCGVSVNGTFYRILHVVPYDPKRYGAVTRIVFNAKDVYLRDNFDFISRECSAELKRRESPRADWIVTWIPRRKNAVRQAGHDQSLELARRIAAELGCACRGVFVNRGKNAQKRQSFEGRLRNAFAAYRLKRGAESLIRGKTVILVDDLTTTGATQHAAISLLSSGGAMRVIPMTYAKTDSEFKKYKMRHEDKTPGRT